MSEYDSAYGICPYCGCKHGDMWEIVQYDGDEVEMYCDRCERKFLVSVSIDVTYTTTEVDDEA